MRNQHSSYTVLTLLILILAGFSYGQKSTFPAPIQKTLLNKLPVLIWQEPGTKKVAISLRIHSGSEFDRKDREGTLVLLTRVMFPDNGLFEDFSENLGGSLSIRTGFDYIQIDSTADADKLVDVLEIIGSAITTADINKTTTAEAKKGLIESVSGQTDSPKHVADAATLERLYGDFPYGRLPDGSAESLEAIDFADLIFARDRFFTADNASLSIKGDVDVNYAYRAARRLLGSWRKSNRIVPSNFTLPDKPETGSLTVNTDSGVGVEQRYAVEAASRKSTEYYPAAILTQILNDRLSSSETRSVVLNSFYLRGYMMFSETVLNAPDTSNGDVPPLPESEPVNSERTKTPNTFAELLGQKITPAEFDSAKNSLVSKFKSGSIADHWFDVTTYKLISVKDEFAKLNAVTLDAVQKAASTIAGGVFVDVSVVPLSSVDPANSNDPDDPR